MGSYLTSILGELGAEPVVVDVQQHVNQMVNVLDVASVNHLVKSYQPWAAIYLTASIYGDPSTQRSLNVDGFNNVLEAVLRYMPEARFIGVGTSAEYGIIPSSPVEETFECKPISPYGETKLEACKLMLDRVENRGLWGNWVRPSNLIGVGMSKNLIIPQLLAAAKSHQQTFDINNPDAIRDFLGIEDFCGMLTATIASNRVGQIYNASMGSGVTMQELAQRVSDISGFKINLNAMPVSGNSSNVDYFVADNSKAKTQLGWSPQTDLSQMITSVWESLK